MNFCEPPISKIVVIGIRRWNINKRAIQIALVGAALLHAASFETASIKPSSLSGPGGSFGDETPGLLRLQNVTLRQCVKAAYGVRDSQIVGGPKWMSELHYDIVARADHPAGDDELMELLRTLLVQRFQLTIHHETQTLPGYALVVAKGGIRMTPSSIPDSQGTTNTSKTRGTLEATACSISKLAAKLSDILDGAPVIDESGANGNFDFTLRWTPESIRANAGISDSLDGPSIFTAVEEQLGLRLESRRVRADILVVDRAELPSEN
jgi:uncharacterized protein (TIGR03435 family)